MKATRKRTVRLIGGIVLAVVLAVLLIVLSVGQRQSEDSYNVQYIRTNGYVDGAKYPKVTLIRSVDELEAYYEANRDEYYLERGGSSNNAIGFLDACDKYDEAYFSRQGLVLVLLEEGSGSISHNVTKVESSTNVWGTGLQIHIERQVPEWGTCDMAEWHLFIELPADIRVTDEDRVTVYIDGVDRTN